MVFKCITSTLAFPSGIYLLDAPLFAFLLAIYLLQAIEFLGGRKMSDITDVVFRVGALTVSLFAVYFGFGRLAIRILIWYRYWPKPY
jgi:hypothetical protein